MNQFAAIIVITFAFTLARSDPRDTVTCCVVNASFNGSRHVLTSPVVLGLVLGSESTLEAILGYTPARVWMDLNRAHFPMHTIAIKQGNITLMRRTDHRACITGMIIWGRVVRINSQLEAFDGTVLGWIRADLHPGWQMNSEWTGSCKLTTDAPITDHPTVGPRIPIISPTEPLLPIHTNTPTGMPAPPSSSGREFSGCTRCIENPVPRPPSWPIFPQTITGVPIGDLLVGILGTLLLGVIAFGGVVMLGVCGVDCKSEAYSQI